MSSIANTLFLLEQGLLAATAADSPDNALIDELLRQCEAMFVTERLLNYTEEEVVSLIRFSEVLSKLIDTLSAEQAALKKDLTTLQSGKKMRKHFS